MEVLSSPLQRSGAMWCITRRPTKEKGERKGARETPRKRTAAQRTGAGDRREREAEQQSARPR
jgi:hypothetical protein